MQCEKEFSPAAASNDKSRFIGGIEPPINRLFLCYAYKQ